MRCRRLVQRGTYCAQCEPYNSPEWRALSAYIQARDNATCRTCCKYCPGKAGAASHIVDYAHGGQNIPENLRWLCTEHNSAERGTL